MIAFILIVMTTTTDFKGYGNYAARPVVTMQRFENKAGCLDAAKEVQRLAGNLEIRTTCVPEKA